MQYRYAKANNKYIKNYANNKELLYIQHLDAKKLYLWAVPQKLPVNGFEWVRYISSLNKNLEKFIKLTEDYDEDSDKGYTLEVDVEYPKHLHDLHSDLPFLPEIMKINKCNKLLCNSCDKKEFVIHMRALKQVSNHWLILKKVYRVI